MSCDSAVLQQLMCETSIPDLLYAEIEKGSGTVPEDCLRVIHHACLLTSKLGLTLLENPQLIPTLLGSISRSLARPKYTLEGDGAQSIIPSASIGGDVAQSQAINKNDVGMASSCARWASRALGNMMSCGDAAVVLRVVLQVNLTLTLALTLTGIGGRCGAASRACFA